jgi:hypothetical protein
MCVTGMAETLGMWTLCGHMKKFEKTHKTVLTVGHKLGEFVTSHVLSLTYKSKVDRITKDLVDALQCHPLKQLKKAGYRDVRGLVVRLLDSDAFLSRVELIQKLTPLEKKMQLTKKTGKVLQRGKLPSKSYCQLVFLYHPFPIYS